MPLTKHHLIPRSTHDKRQVRLRFNKQERLTNILWLCRSCHNHIHYCLTEIQMAKQYHSKESLLSVTEIKEFCLWLSNKDPGFTPKQRRKT